MKKICKVEIELKEKEELQLWDETIIKELIESGVEEKFPDMNSAILAKAVDMDILYNMLREQINKQLFNKARNETD